MSYDHDATRIHRADLDREIESLRTERLLAASSPTSQSVVDRARRRTGNALIAAGRALGGEIGALRVHGA
jgi:hypothetical protein